MKDIKGRVPEAGQLIRVYSEFYITLMDEGILKAERLDKGKTLYLPNWDESFEIIGNVRPLESPYNASVLKEALKNIAELCGVVNFSSHNQMKEAVNGAMELAEAALSEYSTQSLSQPRSPQGNIKPRPLAASFLDWISFEGYMRLSEPAGHKWFKIGQAAETYSADELLEMFCTEINNDSQPDNRESKGAPADEIDASISEGEDGLRKKIEGYKIALWIADVPQVIIDNPTLLIGLPPNPGDIKWAEEKVKELLTRKQ